MRRVFLHLIFWAVYLLQDTLLQFLWVSPALGAFSERQQLLMAFEAGAAVLVPKLLFTYCVLYCINQLLKEHKRMLPSILMIVLLLCATLLTYRIIFVYYVDLHIYGGAFKQRGLINVFQLLLALMDIGCVSGVAVTLKLLRGQLTAKEREKSLVKEKLETELRFLRNQTNPHFLFNTLNNIYALARKQSPQTAPVVMKLSQLLRFMLYESGNEQVPVAAEIHVLNDYLDLEKIRYNERLQLEFIQDIDDDTRKIAPLLLLPFVENAFKHGVSESRFHSFVRIELRLAAGQLSFTIDNTSDNGDSPVSDKIGLGNVRRQLQLMYKEHSLNVHNGPHVFSVHLTINLDSYAKI